MKKRESKAKKGKPSGERGGRKNDFHCLSKGNNALGSGKKEAKKKKRGTAEKKTKNTTDRKEKRERKKRGALPQRKKNEG